MSKAPKSYFSGIEKKLIELINESEKSIKIAMAWFTSPQIKKCLIQKKISNPSLEISIVVDDNDINKNFFFNSKSDFEKVGIEIKENVSDRFLHHKFMVIDERIIITGSYNYSQRASSNSENIVVIKSSKLGSNYSRIFEFLTSKHYLDENVKLLFDNPRFAQKIISAYYEFDEDEYFKYRDKIVIGDCYTHFNGMHDVIDYNPGIIFNPILSKRNYYENKFSEFSIPIKKEDIKHYLKDRNESLIIDSFEGDEENYHLINGELEKNEKSIKKYFKRKMEKTYRYSKLERLIKDGVDIILEDDLWVNNFEPFLNKEIIEKIFDNIEITE